MKQIVILSCTAKKKSYPCSAAEMYSASQYFVKAYQYAKLIGDEIFILSTKYGLLYQDEVIDPYDETLNNKTENEKSEWAKSVIEKLRSLTDIQNDNFTLIMGRTYYEQIIPQLAHYAIPLKGKNLNLWIPSLNKLIQEYKSSVSAIEIHKEISKLPTYNGLSISDIPFENGVYIMFDKAETFYGYPRIIRIGTHTGQGNLKRRLRDHFMTEDQRGSIFRKNIGRALLILNKEEYLPTWDLQKITRLVDLDYEKQIEKHITKYIIDHVSFSCIAIYDKSTRLRIEEGLLSSLNQDVKFFPPLTWFGKFSPIPEIAKSGLWNYEGLYGRPLTYEEFERLKSPDSKVGLFQSAKINNSELNKHITLDKEIQNFITNELSNAFKNEKPHVDIVSNKIHAEMNLEDKMKNVCNAMYKLRRGDDKVFPTTFNGFSYNLKIRYFAKNH